MCTSCPCHPMCWTLDHVNFLWCHKLFTRASDKDSSFDDGCKTSLRVPQTLHRLQIKAIWLSMWSGKSLLKLSICSWSVLDCWMVMWCTICKTTTHWFVLLTSFELANVLLPPSVSVSGSPVPSSQPQYDTVLTPDGFRLTDRPAKRWKSDVTKAERANSELIYWPVPRPLEGPRFIQCSEEWGMLLNIQSGILIWIIKV